jgi:hypothetical protein
MRVTTSHLLHDPQCLILPRLELHHHSPAHKVLRASAQLSQAAHERHASAVRQRLLPLLSGPCVLPGCAVCWLLARWPPGGPAGTNAGAPRLGASCRLSAQFNGTMHVWVMQNVSRGQPTIHIRCNRARGGENKQANETVILSHSVPTRVALA